MSYPEDVAEALMIDGRAPSSEVDEIYSMLMDVLSVPVELVDLDEKRSHARILSSWLSQEVATEGLEVAALVHAQTVDDLCVRINRRWMLRVAGHGVRVADDGRIVTYERVPLSMQQVAFVERAAERLSPLLPATSTLSDVPWPNGTSGGGPGVAELGIPLWWVRKVRN